MLPHTYHSQILERPSALNVLQRSLQILQLGINLALGLLGALHSLGLERLNRLHLPAHIVLLDLERAHLLLDVVDDGGVLQDGAVVREVDGLGLLGEHLDPALRIVVALLEGLEGLSGAAAQAEFLGQGGPVELRDGGALWRGGLAGSRGGEKPAWGIAGLARGCENPQVSLSRVRKGGFTYCSHFYVVLMSGEGIYLLSRSAKGDVKLELRARQTARECPHHFARDCALFDGWRIASRSVDKRQTIAENTLMDGIPRTPQDIKEVRTSLAS